MAQPMRDVTPYASPGHRFGAELRHWRTMRQLTAEALGRAVHYDKRTISAIELGDRNPSRELAAALDAALSTGGVLQRMMPAVEAHRAAIREANQARRDRITAQAARPHDIGFAWPGSADEAATAAIQLWRADLDDAPELLRSTWSPTELDAILDAWQVGIAPLAARAGGTRWRPSRRPSRHRRPVGDEHRVR